MELKTMRFVTPVNRKHFVSELLEDPVSSEESVLVPHECESCGIVQDCCIYVVFTIPLFLDDSVHDTAAHKTVEVVFIKVPKAIIALVVCFLDKDEQVLWIIIDVQHFDNLVT